MSTLAELFDRLKSAEWHIPAMRQFEFLGDMSGPLVKERREILAAIAIEAARLCDEHDAHDTGGGV